MNPKGMHVITVMLMSKGMHARTIAMSSVQAYTRCMMHLDEHRSTFSQFNHHMSCMLMERVSSCGAHPLLGKARDGHRIE